MNTPLPKGITQRQKKDGTVVYRVDTCVNGKRIKSPTGTLEYALKEFFHHFRYLHIQHI